MRRWLLIVPMGLAACQCFVPVDEGGGDGGQPRDSGVDSGVPGLPCATASDCPLQPAAFEGCTMASSPESCFDHRCVRDCTAVASTCTSNSDFTCITCTPAATPTICAAVTCGTSQRCASGTLLTVEASSCAKGPVAGSTWRARALADCTVSIDSVDGGPALGTVFAWSSGQLVGRLAGIGTCSSRSLFTGLPRSWWACPGQCEFRLVGCE